MRQKVKALIKHPTPETLFEKETSISGWIRTVRDQKSFLFIELNDGSTLGNIQIIVDSTTPHFSEFKPKLTTGASVRVDGIIKKSPGDKQPIEIHASKVVVYGLSDPAKYPLQKKRHSFEFLRSIAHLRPRTNTGGAVLRVRSALAQATHEFFREKGFVYLHTPIITGSDCEGGGEMFRVTTLEDLKKDPKEDFFGKKTYLTVSGQLEAEIAATALSDVYTFGPTFRAENSNTSRHLAEFWMIEPEIAFADLNDVMDLAEGYFKYCIQYVQKHCEEDLNFFDKFVEKGLLEKLSNVTKDAFARVTYTEAIEILKTAKKTFEFPVKWGLDLQSEHERFLAEEHFNRPVIVTDYPKEIKAFYMRENEDGKTVAAMDILAPKIGEIIGGSQREERLSILEEKMNKMGLPKEEYWWYLELREYGTVPHGGFGLGFERLVLFVTGMENIRDVIPFPRTPSHAEF